MESKNMIGGIVSLAVVVICVAAIMMPVLSDATQTHETFTNEGLFNYGVFTPEDTYTLEYDAVNGLTVNGTAVSIDGVAPGTTSTRYSVIASDNVIFRFGSASDAYLAQIVGVDSNGTGRSPAAYSASITTSDDTISITYRTTEDGADTTYTFDFEEMYAIVPSADVAIEKASAETVYIKGDSEIYGSGLTTVSTWSNMFHLEGTYDDGITITSPNLPDATYDNIEWNIEEVDGYEDLYELTSIEFDILYNDSTVHATYSYFAVPTEVTAELSQHLDDGEIALLNAIPVLVIVSLVIAAVGLAITSRRD